MNNWVVLGIVLCVLLIGGIAFVSAISTNQQDASTAQATCTSCGGRCTAGNNCGLASCGAVNGGKCNCGKR